MTSERRLHCLLLLVLLLGGVLRFSNLDAKPPRFDEVFTRLNVTGHDEHNEVNPSLYTGRLITPRELLGYLSHAEHKRLWDTGRALVTKNANKTPLYFLFAWSWSSLFGDSLAGYRALSALFGLLALPACYWLCGELRFTKEARLFTVALLAVSPVLVRQAQDARPYSLWLLTTILLCASYLRAIRKNSGPTWLTYFALLVLSFYTHLLTGVVALVLLLHTALFGRGRWTQNFLKATLAGGLALAPWLYLTLPVVQTFVTSGHLNRSLPPAITLREWSFNVAHLLFAAGSTHLEILLAPLVLALLWFAASRLRASTASSTWMFLILLLVVTAGLLVLLDLGLGGQRSVRGRYFVPGYLASVLIMGRYFGQLWTRSLAARVFTLLILVSALASSLFSVRAETWWGREEADQEVAAVINSYPNPIIVSDENFGVLAMAADNLEDHVRLFLTRDRHFQPPPSDGGVFLIYQPSSVMLQRIRSFRGNRVKLLLWRERWDGGVVALYLWER